MKFRIRQLRRFSGDLIADLRDSDSGRFRGEFGIVVLTRMATVCGGLVFVLLTARSLGPSGRGEIVVAFTLAWLTTNIANLGTPISGRFHLLRGSEQVRAIDVMLLTVSLLPVQILLV